MIRRIFNFVYWTLIVGSVLPLQGQDSVVAGHAPQSPQEQSEWVSINPDVCIDEVVAPAEHVATIVYMSDSSSAESEAEAYFYVNNKIANSRDSYEVPIEIGQFVDQIDPVNRRKMYDKHSRVASIIPALINFFPIPFLGSIILNDTFGGYLVGGAALITFIAIPGAASQCVECQSAAAIMLYAAGGLAAWAAVRPFYLFQKNSNYNRALAAVLRPPGLTFISLKPVLQANMAAGVIVPAMQLAIGF